MLIINKLLVRRYHHSRIYSYYKLKDGFTLDLFWITFTYPVNHDYEDLIEFK